MNKESKKLSGLLGDSVDKKRKQLEVLIFGVKTLVSDRRHKMRDQEVHNNTFAASWS